MSGPISNKVGNRGLSLASPPVNRKAIGKPPKSVFRWIFVEKPPRDLPRDSFSCPLCRRRRHVRAHDGRVEHLDEVRGFAETGEGFEEKFEHAGLAQSPEPFPNAVPVCELDRQRAPRDIVNREIQYCLKEKTIVLRLVPAPRQRRLEDAQHVCPIMLGELREHRRFPRMPTAHESQFSGFGNPTSPQKI